MLPKRWFDPSQPQTLQIAIILEYLNAGLAILFLLLGMEAIIPALLLVAEGVGATGVANENRWGYNLSIGTSAAYLALTLTLGLFFGGGLNILGLILSIALVALLLHPMSRSYQQVYFH
jgi:hypothetical protein